jgi:hypothetical protein
MISMSAQASVSGSRLDKTASFSLGHSRSIKPPGIDPGGSPFAVRKRYWQVTVVGSGAFGT